MPPLVLILVKSISLDFSPCFTYWATLPSMLMVQYFSPRTTLNIRQPTLLLLLLATVMVVSGEPAAVL